jgi:quinol monooxygenase YgiN
MERFRHLGLGMGVLAMMSLSVTEAARAADAAYIVTYIEVRPAAAGEASGLLKQLAAASRKDAGNAGFEVLQRIGQSHHFAIVETWKDKDAQAAHAMATHTRAFRERLQPLLIGPYDERPHIPLEVASKAAPPAGGVYAVTHVDIVPTFKEKGWAMVKDLAVASRQDAGNVRFDAFQQANRLNHMTLVETWRDPKAVEGHALTAHMKKFREELLPISGSLYDERLYTALQ